MDKDGLNEGIALDVREKLPLHAKLFGPFSLTNKNGLNVAPSSVKARAIVAMVLTSPDIRRSRIFLAETLWSDRARAQALGSLRQALSEIKTALGPNRDLLQIDRKSVSFREDRVSSDLPNSAIQTALGHLFLENVVPSDPAFARWLDTARSQFGLRARIAKTPVLHVHAAGTASPFHKSILTHGVTESIADWCALRIATISDDVDTFDRESSAHFAEFLLEARLHKADTSDIGAQLVFSDNIEQRPNWSVAGVLPNDPVKLLEDTKTFWLINNVVDRSITSLASRTADSATARYLAAGALGAARCIFRNDPGDIELALSQLKRNFDIHRAGIYLAWTAYVTTLQKAESDSHDPQELEARAEDYATRAVELDPYGAMTLALSSYVNSFVLGRPDVGYELAARSLSVNRANPLAWIFRGASQFFRGDGEAARRDTEFAQAIAGNGPYRYVVDTFCCVSSTVSGHLNEAIIYGEAASRKAPRYRAPLRYLAAIHARRGDHDALRDVLRRLKEIEPGFKLDMLEETAYPVPALHRAGLSTIR